MTTNKKRVKNDVNIGEHHDGDFITYMSHKIRKLDDQNQYGFNDDDVISNILHHCYISVNGDTDPPINEIKRLIYINGGIFNSYYKNDTTHIICERLTDAQVLHMSKKKRIVKNNDVKYVTTKWLIESIRKGLKEPESLYPPDGLITYGSNLSALFTKPNDNNDDNSDNDDDNANITNDNITTANNNITNDNNNKANSTMSFYSTRKTSYMKDNDGNIIDSLNKDDKQHASNTNNNTNTNTNANSSSSSSSSNRNTINKPTLNSEENPLFMEQFFQNSRLHFIGTWRNRLEQLLKKFPRQLQQSPSKLKGNDRIRLILHIDLDCFFVNVLLRNEQHLHNQPVAVAHSNKAGSSEISSCNYPARSYGLKNGMFMFDAMKLCPKLIVKPYDFKAYEEVGLKFYEILFTSGALITEAVSVDEAYLEYGCNINGLEKAENIRQRIYEETGGCTASVGIGNNKLLARLATKKAKPNGTYQIQENEEEIKEFLSNLPVEELPGIGWKNTQKLKEKGLLVCGDIIKQHKQNLITWFGDALGAMLYDTARGIDVRELDAVKPRNSLGAEVNWGLRFTNFDKAIHFLKKLANEVARRLEEVLKKGVTVTIKIKVARAGERLPSKFLGHGICDDISKSITLKKFIHTGDEIADI
jgi:DNA repair protein REV1